MGRDLNLERDRPVFKPRMINCKPTADGTGLGTIPDNVDVVTVTAASGSANDWLTLPAVAYVGQKLTIFNTSGQGMELRTNAPATVSINGGSGATAESAVASTALRIELVAISLTAWIANSYVAAGTESAVEAAA